MSSRPVPTEAILKPKPSDLERPSTFSALRYSGFRLYFAGQLVSVSGTWMQTIAQQIVVYNMTKSDLALGLVACAQGLPALILTPFAGVIVERVSRRKLLVMTQFVMMVLAFIMTLLWVLGTLQLWHVMVLSLGLGIANAVDAPARLAFLVEMVGHEDLSSGIVLNSMMFNVARIVGPALGGLALKGIGEGWCFFLNGVSFMAVLFSLIVMTIEHPVKPGKIARGFLRPLAEGFMFAVRHPTIWPLLVLSALTSTFGLTFTVLIPPFADNVLRDTAGGTSAMLTAQGIGALVATVLIARISNRGHRGRFLTIGAFTGPIAIILLAFTNTYLFTLPAVGLAGFGLICQYVLTNTLLQTEVPDDFRGRVMSLYSVSFFGLTPFGSLAIGLTAQAFSVPDPAFGPVISLLIFGGICLIGALVILVRSPAVRRLP